MKRKITGIIGVALLLAGTASAQYTNTVYSEYNDGLVEFRGGWIQPTNHWENGTSQYGTIGEWFGTNGLVCTVLPFRIPDLGAVAAPFTSANLQVFLERNDLLTAVDLYFVRVATNADLVATSDYFSGTSDVNAALLQADFITSLSGASVSLNTDVTGSGNLLTEINAAYDGGAGAGSYAFLRLSYSSDSWPTNADSAAIFTRNNNSHNNWPTLFLGSNLDSDSDGLPNGWEGEYGLNPNDDTGDNGAAGDPDGDGRTNLQEYTDGTDPQNILDGALDAALYGAPVATQSINTAWGENENELNAAYAYVSNRRLYLMLTGNINDAWNKVEIFFDTTDEVQTNVLNTTDFDEGYKMDGMTFDAGFEPDYHCFFRRSSGSAYFDIINLAQQTNSNYGSLFAGEGTAKTGTGNANDYFVEVAYNDSNTGGVTGDAGGSAAATDHWTNSLHGLELSIDLRDLGNPAGEVKIAVMLNGQNRDYLSNQVLAGLPAGTAQLGGDMAGGWDGTLTNINFNAVAGNQFFLVDVGLIPSADFSISQMMMVSGGTQVELGLVDLTVGSSYRIQDTPDLGGTAFSDVAGSGFTATNTSETVTVPASGSAQFYQAVSP